MSSDGEVNYVHIHAQYGGISMPNMVGIIYYVFVHIYIYIYIYLKPSYYWVFVCIYLNIAYFSTQKDLYNTIFKSVGWWFPVFYFFLF